LSISLAIAKRSVSKLTTLRWDRSQWVLVPLLVFLVSRLLGGWFIVLGAAQQVPLLETSPAYTVKFPTPGAPGYLGVATNWDGQWYRSIAENGYPISLPTENGRVLQNEWAFFPVFPLLARGLMLLTHWDFAFAGTVISVVAALGGCLILYRLLLRTGGRPVAIAGVVGLCAFPTAPAFQVAYSEGITLLLLAASLDALSRHRYARLIPLVIVLSLTRPVVLPLAGVIGVHGILRWRRSGIDRSSRRDFVILGAAGLLAAASAGLWPITAAIVTGRADAYTSTQAAWVANQGVHGLWGNWFVDAAISEEPLTNLGILIAAVVLLALLALRPGTDALGGEVRSWSVAYPLFLLLATRPTPSMLRYLMLGLLPLWPIPAGDHDRSLGTLDWASLGVVTAAGLAAQYLWVTRVFTVAVAPELQSYP
jgi:hypothetical protein